MSDRRYDDRRYDDRPRRPRPDYDDYDRPRPRKKKRKAKMKPSFYFLCVCVVYTLILLIGAGLFLGYADRCLNRFEKSQSSYAIEDYFKEFKESLAAKELPKGFVSEESSKFEDSDLKLEALIAATDGKTLSYEKDAQSYDTEEPIYDILADGEAIAKITLSAYNSKTVFGILTIMDWKIKSAEFLNMPSLADYSIWAPEGCSVTVNGIPVSSDYLTGEKKDLELFANAKEYIDIPSVQEYKIPALSKEPEVSITDENGKNVDFTQDGTTYEAAFGSESEIPDDMKETALNIAETWSLFNTVDLSGPSYGLETVRQYLIPDSYYDGLAKQWATSVDITFTSPHTLEDPKFKNVEVSQYRRITDDCFSVRISFDKPMHLTRTGEIVMDHTDSEYLFVRYEASWRMVDMIAATNNADDGGEE